MNFLELCQRVRQESGGVSGTGPTTVTGQSGQLKKLVTWTNAAWRELQLMHDDWLWKRKDFTLTLSASDNDYAAADCTPAVTDLGEWDLETFRIYQTSAGVSDQTGQPPDHRLLVGAEVGVEKNQVGTDDRLGGILGGIVHSAPSGRVSAGTGATAVTVTSSRRSWAGVGIADPGSAAAPLP